MNRIGTCGILVILIILIAMVHPVPSSAAVEIATGTVTPADGNIAEELVAAFDQAELAVQKADLDMLMLFYDNGYNYHGLKRSDVRRVWSEVFSHYGQIMSRHLFTEFKVVHAGSTTKAFVTCTGGLYGIEKESGKSVTIDSWVREVHFLVKDQKAWRFLGNVGGAPPEVPPTSAPHHPLF